MNKGDIVVNFELVDKIDNIEDFVKYLDENKSIFWRFKVMPTSFFYSWHLREIMKAIKSGSFWTINKVNNK